MIVPSLPSLLQVGAVYIIAPIREVRPSTSSTFFCYKTCKYKYFSTSAEKKIVKRYYLYLQLVACRLVACNLFLVKLGLGFTGKKLQVTSLVTSDFTSISVSPNFFLQVQATSYKHLYTSTYTSKFTTDFVFRFHQFTRVYRKGADLCKTSELSYKSKRTCRPVTSAEFSLGQQKEDSYSLVKTQSF